MLALLDELRRRAIPAVKLGVRADNVVACGFYERYGWECVCEHPTRSGAPGRTYVYRIDDRPGAGRVKG
jgi:ribosomal protein S18 acetylase RimI-like enzyme